MDNPNEEPGMGRNNICNHKSGFMIDLRHTTIDVISLLSCICDLNYLERWNGNRVESDVMFGKYFLFFCFQGSPMVNDSQPFDVIFLLKSGNGVLNYLNRNGGDQLVEVIETFGKYIMVGCFHVPMFRVDYDSLHLQSLVTKCSDLYSTKHDLQMVLAEYEAVLNYFISGFRPPCPCLIVPFTDSKRCDFICEYLDFNGPSKCLIPDDNIIVLFNGRPTFVSLHGADTFPFTREHQQKLYENDFPLWKSTSTSNLEQFLQCKPSDVDRINSAGVREVKAISELSTKLVGLYLCITRDFIYTLNKVYQQCITKHLAIEILVYTTFTDCCDPQVHMAKMDILLRKQKIYWWHFPFNNSVSLKLTQIVRDIDDNEIISVRCQGEFVYPFGGNIIWKFGIEKYPFTREGLVQRELNKLRALTLESLLVHESWDFVLRGDDKIPVPELRGRNILMYFCCLDSLEHYEILLSWYCEMKALGSEFEVVFVRRNTGSTKKVEDDLVISAMPWLVCPFDFDHSASLTQKLFTMVKATAHLDWCEEIARILAVRRKILKHSGGGEQQSGGGEQQSGGGEQQSGGTNTKGPTYLEVMKRRGAGPSHPLPSRPPSRQPPLLSTLCLPPVPSNFNPSEATYVLCLMLPKSFKTLHYMPKMDQFEKKHSVDRFIIHGLRHVDEKFAKKSGAAANKEDFNKNVYYSDIGAVYQKCSPNLSHDRGYQHLKHQWDTHGKLTAFTLNEYVHNICVLAQRYDMQEMLDQIARVISAIRTRLHDHEWWTACISKVHTELTRKLTCSPAIAIRRHWKTREWFLAEIWLYFNAQLQPVDVPLNKHNKREWRIGYFKKNQLTNF